MRGGFFRGLLLAILLIAAGAGIAIYAYNAGVAQGWVESGKLIAPAAGIAPYPYYRPFFFHPFGVFGCLVTLFFFFLIFTLIRGIFWRGHWGWGHGMHREHWDKGVPSPFEEWHKRAHEPKTTSER